MAEMNQTFEASAYTARGTARDKVELPAEMFDGTVNMPVMHQAVRAYLANQRQGTASTKIRKYVTGGNQKPWKQKGTGRARQGSIRAPHWVGGGTVFGPTPRDYAERVPKQVKALARRSALNARAREDAIVVIDAFTYEAPKTKQVVELLDRLDLTGRKVLILTDGSKPAVALSARNLPTVHAMPWADASTYHILWSDVVLIEAPAIGQTLVPVAEEEPADRAKRAKTKRAAKPPRGESETAADETAAAPARGKKGAKPKTGVKKPAAAAKGRGAKAAAKKTDGRTGAAAKKSPGGAAAKKKKKGR